MLVKELAASTGIKKKTLDSYLGKQGYKPSVDSAVSIAKALGVSVEYLVTGKVDKNNRSFLSLPAHLREIFDLYEKLSAKDRSILLYIAKMLQNR